MYDPDSDDGLNRDLGIAEHDDNSNNDHEQYILISKYRNIKNTKKNKPSSLTVKNEYLKVTHTKKINKKDNDETMDTSYNKDQDKYEGMILDSKP